MGSSSKDKAKSKSSSSSSKSKDKSSSKSKDKKSSSKDKKSKSGTVAAGGASSDQKLVKGAKVWVASDGPEQWQSGEVLSSMAGASTAIVRLDGGKDKKNTVNTLAYLQNPRVESDMTALWHIHEPAILYNLEQRSWEDEPYTFMGPVLVAVNPLKRISDPKGVIGTSKATLHAHPFAVAETAFQQLKFANMQAKNDAAISAKAVKSSKKDKGVEKGKAKAAAEVQPVNQSVVVGGESGAGKTESSKMVLRHLVERSGGGGIDKQLLNSNPILEAFGNAATTRNANSSRFGKFMKLHFDTAKADKIVRASVDHYLLERSRITQHETGERGYHVFYQLIGGSDSKLKKKLGLGEGRFRYLQPQDHSAPSRKKSSDGADSISPVETSKEDAKFFGELTEALESVGISSDDQEKLFRVVAAVLHLGNIHFDQVEKSEGDVAVVKGGKDDPAKWAAGLLGLDRDALIKLFCERAIEAAGEKTVAYRNAQGAAFARDAVAKALYTRLFEYVVKRINESFVKDGKKSKKKDDSGGGDNKDMFIGVLDIFGFESFKRNDFEQLLINFCNSALQSTFNKQVFEAEAQLYKREGLVISNNEKIAPPPNNEEGMALLTALLTTIDAEGRMPQANDNKLNEKFHRTFAGNNKCFLKIHPKDRQTTFAVFHYAGAVTYTVGSFLQKNSDRLPNEVDFLFETSESGIVPELWGGKTTDENASLVRSLGKKKNNNGSIVAKFKGQITRLVDTLDETRCSFIRCVKPNAHMKRKEGDGSWFDRSYVTMQLKCLSIPQTAEVLKTGLPTRITYASLVETYKNVLPKDAIRAWKKLGGGSETGFVGALFWAFEIERGDYKLGLTRVFFRSGMLATLDKVLSAAREWEESGKGGKEKDKIVKRFKVYHARRRWRVCFAIVTSALTFKQLLVGSKQKAKKAIVIQRAYRGYRARVLLRAVVMAQAMQRGRLMRKKLKKLRKKRKEQLAKQKIEKEKLAKKNKEELKKQKKKEEEAKKKSDELEKKKSSAKGADKERLEKESKEAKAYAKEQSKKASKMNQDQSKAEKELEGMKKTDEDNERVHKKREERGRRESETRGSRLDAKLAKSEEKHSRRGDKKAATEQKRRTRRRRSMALLTASNKTNGDPNEKPTVEWIEEVVEPGPPLDGPVLKLAVKSQRNWKMRFFRLNREEQRIRYWKQQGAPKVQGEFKLLGNSMDAKDKDKTVTNRTNNLEWPASMTKSKVIKHQVYKKKAFVLEIQGGDTGEKVTRNLFLAFVDAFERDMWARAIEESIHGYRTRKIQRVVGKTTHARGDVAIALALNSMAMAQLNDLENMVDRGEIDEATYEMLLPTVLQEVQENPDGMGPSPDNSVVACPNPKCGANTNSQWERRCRECDTELVHQRMGSDSEYEEPDAPEQQPLCHLPLQGGTFIAYLTGNKSAMDVFGLLHRLYSVVCRWEKEGVRTEQWTMSYQYTGYRSLRKVLKSFGPGGGGGGDDDDEDGGEGGIELPKLPKRRRTKAPDETGSTVLRLPAADRTRYLQAFLRYIFQMDMAMELTSKGDSVLLDTEEVDRFFEIREHTVDAGKMSAEVSEDDSGDSSAQPLDAYELSQCETVVTRLHKYLSLDDPKKEEDQAALAKFMNACLHFQPRLEASMDLRNKFAIQSLVDRATECQLMMNKTLKLYTDTFDQK